MAKKKSVKKRPPTKKTKATKNARPTQTQKRKKSNKQKVTPTTLSSQNLFYLLIGLFSIGFLFFVVNYVQLDDNTNEFIESEQRYLHPVQWILYLGFSFLAIWYAIKAFRKKVFEKLDWILLGAGFLFGIILYTLILNGGLSDNGDNASYIINAKSLVERGAAIKLHLPKERPDALASLGLPLMLSPVYAIWGMDIFKMKFVIYLMAIGLFPILFYMFRIITSDPVAALLTIVVFTHPVLFSSSSYIMTETPFMFWLGLSTLSIMKYNHTEKLSIPWLVLSLLSLGMLYFTRAIGAGAFIAAAIYLIIHMPLVETIKNSSYKSLFRTVSFKKFAAWIAPVVVIGIVYFGYKLITGGPSQLNIFRHIDKIDIWDNFWKSYTMTWWVLSQIDFADNTIRWLNFMPGADKLPLNFMWITLNLVMIFGFLYSLWKKHYMALASLFILLLLFIFNPATNAAMAMTRYLMVLVPFYIFFLYIGIRGIATILSNHVSLKGVESFGKVLAMSSLFFILFSNFSGNSFFIGITNNGYTHIPTLEGYFEAAKWCKSNTPEDAIIASRKPRLFYLYSERKGVGTTDITESYDASKDQEKINKWREDGVDYLIYDRFSTKSRENILPLLENNAQNFQLVYQSPGPYVTFVVKLKY